MFMGKKYLIGNYDCHKFKLNIYMHVHVYVHMYEKNIEKIEFTF